MRVIDYLRVSTSEQELENCQAEILRFGARGLSQCPQLNRKQCPFASLRVSG